MPVFTQLIPLAALRSELARSMPVSSTATAEFAAPWASAVVAARHAANADGDGVAGGHRLHTAAWTVASGST